MLVDRQANNQVMCRKYFDKADAAPLCLSPFFCETCELLPKNLWAPTIGGRGEA